VKFVIRRPEGNREIKMMFARPLFASLLGAAVCVTALGTAATLTPAFAAGGTEVKVIVSGNAITNGDIQRRAAFLKLQRKGGNLNQVAREELTEEMLKRVEMKSRGINISDQEVDQAYAGFATRNKMSVAQLNQLMNQAGITPDHFKKYIMVQMGWGRLVSARFRATGMVSEQDAVQRMLKDGGKKPVSTEYHLQQCKAFACSARQASPGSKCIALALPELRHYPSANQGHDRRYSSRSRSGYRTATSGRMGQRRQSCWRKPRNSST
jgi:hypothetical protein